MACCRLVGMIALVMTLLGCNGDHPSAGAPGSSPMSPSPPTMTPNIVTVMTQNMDDGTDFGPIFGALTLDTLKAAAAATYAEVQASNIPERATALASEIVATQPDVVGLQEVSLWRTGPA